MIRRWLYNWLVKDEIDKLREEIAVERAENKSLRSFCRAIHADIKYIRKTMERQNV